MSDDSKELSRVEDILSGEDYLPKKPMSRVEELLMDGAMVPKVDDTDNGKVLKVIDGEWQPGEDVSGDNLPPVSSLDNGKVLKVVSGEWNIGDDKSESSFVYISSSYPFSGSKVALPANINSVLIANYTSSPKVPTFLVTSNNIIFEPKEVDISVGTTPSVHIRWGRMYSTFDSATREQDIYNDSISYNTQNQTTEASYFKTKAIQTIPPVDVPDNGKVMQVAGGHWVANILPEVYGVPVVEQADVGKVLKATAVGEYDWGDAPDPLPSINSSDNGKVLTARNSNWVKETLPKDAYFINVVFYGGEPILPTGLGITLADINPTIPVYLLNNTVGSDDNGKVYTPVFIDSTIVLGVKENAEWQCISTETVNGEEVTYVERIVYYMNADDRSEETVTYTKEELDIPDPLPAVTSVDNGKVLKVVEGAWAAGADEGGSEAVYKTLAEYEALPTADKEDPTKIYFVINEGTKVSPTLAADDGNISVSSQNDGYNSWKAFDGSTRSDVYTYEYCWAPWGQNNGEWIAYSFNNQQQFSKVRFRSCQEGSNADITLKYYVEGSNDGTTWNNLLLNKEYEPVLMPKADNTASPVTLRFVDLTFLLDTTLPTYSKIRVRVDQSIGYPYSYNRWSVANFDIYAANTSAIPMIYYKDVLYNPLVKELPNTVVADAGKALVVNSDGEWDKGDIPRTNSVQVPPVIYDNSKLMKIADMTGFPELEKAFLTSEEYAQLTTAQKQDLSKIYYVSPYKFYALKDGEITIRVNGTTYEWFFNGFILTDNYYEIPQEYRQYTKNTPYQGSTAWSDNTSSTSLGIIEMGPSGYTERISAQDGNWAGNLILNTPIYGKVVTGNGSAQTNTYSDPYDVETPILIYYGGKQYTEYTTPSVYREITQDEYDALPSSKNSDGIIYFITDNS